MCAGGLRFEAGCTVRFAQRGQSPLCTSDPMRVALATAEDFPGLDPDDAPLLEALGDGAEPAVWSDPAIDWSAYDAVLIRSIWDYFVRHDEFLAWLDRLHVPTWNPVEVLRWNSEKGYLRELEDAGVRTIPTAWEGEVPWEDAIIKPTIAGGSLGLRRAEKGEPVAPGHMAQPFLPEITAGELSLVFFDGEFSHAIRKTPAEGDIRVQPEHGGIVTPAEPTDAELATARRVLDAAGRDLLYARVDLVGDGMLIELEAIEPRFFFAYAPPQAAGKLAQALRRRN
jgi:glutathione synthase/RimK-type ligase-like ATP-grasp enzyme